MEMFQPFSILLWIAALLCVILYASDTHAQGASSNLYLAIVLVIIIVGTGYMTWSQTAKSDALMDSFKNFLPQ